MHKTHANSGFTLLVLHSHFNKKYYLSHFIAPSSYFNICGPTKFNKSAMNLRNPFVTKTSPWVWHIASNNDGFDVACMVACSLVAIRASDASFITGWLGDMPHFKDDMYCIRLWQLNRLCNMLWLDSFNHQPCFVYLFLPVLCQSQSNIFWFISWIKRPQVWLLEGSTPSSDDHPGWRNRT